MGVSEIATIGTLVVNLIADSNQFRESIEASVKTMKRAEYQVERSARNMARVGRGLMVGVTAPLMLVSGAATKMAIDWEDAFAGVRKTVDATEQQFSELSRGIRDMALEIPKSANELAGIAEAAGQLGIQRESILGFTRTMADLSVASNLAGEEGAMTLAKFANVMQMSQKDFDRLGSVIVDLGNNSATTERDIANFGLRVAGAGKIAGLAVPEVLAIGTAMSSVGVEAEAGGTAVQKVLLGMTQAVATGSKDLAMFAAAAGMSADQFATAWRDDAAGAFASFVEGLGHAGDQSFVILEKLGLTDQRLTRGFLSLANAGGLLRDSINLGNQAWVENTALANEANERYKTMRSQLTMTKNLLVETGITLGEALAPALNTALSLIRPLINGLRNLAQVFADASPVVRNLIIGFGMLAASIGPVMWGYSKLIELNASLIRAKAALVGWIKNVGVAFAGLRAGTLTAGQALAGIFGGKRNLIIIGILALAAATVYLAANWDKFSVIASRIWAGISSVVMYAASMVARAIGMMVWVIGWIVPGFKQAGIAIGGFADQMKAAAQAAWGMATAAKSASYVHDVGREAGVAADNVRDAAQAQVDLAESMDKAQKAAKANLQSFDQVHTLQEEMGAADMTLPEFDFPELDIDVGGGFGGIADSLGESMEKAADIWSRASANIAQGWENLKAKAIETFPWIGDIVRGFGEAAQWVRDNWDTVGPALEVLGGILIGLGAAWLIATFPIAGFVALAGAIALAAAWIIANWDEIGPYFEETWQGILDFVGPIWESIKAAAKDVWESIVETAKVVWERLKQWWERWGDGVLAVFRGLWRQVQLVVQTAINIIKDIIGLVLAVIRGDWEEAWERIKSIGASVWNYLAQTWENIKQTAIEIWEAIGDNLVEIWEGIKEGAVQAWDSITGWLSDKWNGLASWASGIFSSIGQAIGNVWDGVKAKTDAVWKGIVNGIRTSINFVIEGINWMIRQMNKLSFTIPEWVPGFGGEKFGFNISEIRPLPMLATGGNIIGGGAAIVGEAGPELVELPRGARVTPLSGGGAVMDEEIAYRVMFRAMRDFAQINNRGSQSGGDLVLKIGEREFGRIAKDAIDKENSRRGVAVLQPRGV